MDLNFVCAQLNLNPLAQGLQVVDAQEVARDFFPRLDTDRPALIANLAAGAVARNVRRTLLVNYPAAHPATLLDGDKRTEHTLGTLNRAKFSPGAVLYIPPLPEPSSPQTLAALVARLRAPGGCPWDRKQTHTSLRRALLEETYEVIEALDENDPAKLREELGDVFLHVLFQAEIARDQDEFTLAEVGEELAAKLIRRHPHVFGAVEVANAEEVVANWEQIKLEEKKAAGKAQVRPALDANIPHALPALARAQKVYERARRKGIANDHPLPAGVVEGMGKGKRRERALGELLLALTAWAEENELDATSALRAATARFVKQADKAMGAGRKKR
ncbi:MAG: MazG family protein [Anaerolineae bacterium]